MKLLIVALAAMKATDLFKEILPWPPAPWIRSVVALGLSVLLTLLTGATGRDWVLLAAGAWGLSAILHEVVAVLAMTSDFFKLKIIQGTAARRR